MKEFFKRWLIGVIVVVPVICLVIACPVQIFTTTLVLAIGGIIVAAFSVLCVYIGHWIGVWFGAWPENVGSGWWK